ncbi:MAG: transglutaminase family protein [Phycisphaerales bacterium]
MLTHTKRSRKRSSHTRAALAGAVALLAGSTVSLALPSVCVPGFTTVIGSTLAASADVDRWYSLELRGEHAGYRHVVQHTVAGVITTSITQRVLLKRGEDLLELTTESSFVETTAGKPVSMQSTQSIGAAPVTRRYVFSDAGVSVTTILGMGFEPRHETIPREALGGTWLTPAAAAAFVEARLAAGATEFSLRAIDPDRGPVPVPQAFVVLGAAQASVPSGDPGVRKPVAGVEISIADQSLAGWPPERCRRLTDERGVPVETDIIIGGFPFRARLSTEQAATADTEPPQFADMMIIQCEGVLERPRSLVAARFEVSPPPQTGPAPGKSPGSFPAPMFPVGSVQAVERDDRGPIRVWVDVSRAEPAPPSDAGDSRYTDPSTLIDSADPEVMQLSRRAVNGIGDRPAREQVEAMRLFVHHYVRPKSLGVGFASASETARTRTGDCTEQAMLLAAMIRTAGIPARLVIGAVYAESFAGRSNVFVLHMWTQALIDAGQGPCWIDLDPAREAGSFDAAHIAVLHTALEDTVQLRTADRAVRALAGARVRVLSPAAEDIVPGK